MQRKTHWFWDIAVLWPFITVILAMLGFITAILLADSPAEDLIFVLIPLGMMLYFASIVIVIVTYIYSIHQLYTGTKMDNNDKKIWLILIILFNFITIPILHFMHLRKGE